MGLVLSSEVLLSVMGTLVLVLEGRLDEVLLLLMYIVGVIAVCDLKLIASVMGTVSFSVADTVLRVRSMEVEVTVCGLFLVCAVCVACLTAVESLSMLLVHGLLNNKFDWLVDMVVTVDTLVMSNASILRDDVLVSLVVLIRSLLDMDLVMDGLVFGPLARLVMSELVLDFMMVIGAALGVIEGVMDGMLVEVNGLDIMLIIKLVVKGVVVLVHSVPLGLVVDGLVMLRSPFSLVVDGLLVMARVVAILRGILSAPFRIVMSRFMVNGLMMGHMLRSPRSLVMDGLLVMARVVAILRSVLVFATLMRDSLVLIRVAFWAFNGMKDGVLVEVNGLDIVLIVVGVVESVMSLVLGVILDIVLGGLVVSNSLVMRDGVMNGLMVRYGLVVNGLVKGSRVMDWLMNGHFVMGGQMTDNLIRSPFVVDG